MVSLKSKADIEVMREACKIVGETLNFIGEMVKPGITTKEISDAAEKFILSHGGKPSFKNYRGFPAAACVSVNDVVVHGIPNNLKLREGDIVSVDIGALKNGFHGDAARTFAVGDISDEAKKLIEVTRECFFKGIEKAVPGNRIGDVSSAIQKYAEGHGYGVVRSLVGHGIGESLHEDPDVPNFGIEGKGLRLRSGMTLAIEPMINQGTFKVYQEDDGWTIRTADNKLSAHYENTIAILDSGVEVLTLVE